MLSLPASEYNQKVIELKIEPMNKLAMNKVDKIRCIILPRVGKVGKGRRGPLLENACRAVKHD